MAEDKDTGIKAALAWNIKVLSFGYAPSNPKVDYKFKDLSLVHIKMLL